MGNNEIHWQGAKRCLFRLVVFYGEINLNNVIRLALGRLGHAFDTHQVSSKELTQAYLLGEHVTHHNSFTDSKNRVYYRLG